jgi:ubiquinol-cytochrome c reductase cytochrome c subunit
VTWLSARRRHPWAAGVVVLLALLVVGALYSAVMASTRAEATAATAQEQVEEGRALFLQNCSSCHGLNGEGSSDGPTLIGVGAASVDFQVGTGRMPLAGPGAQAPDKPPAFTDEQVAAMAAYVATLGPGPAIPTEEQLDYEDADLTLGGELFRTNCSQCHNFAGEGGALTNGKYAPAIRSSSAKHIYEAMLTGPQSMPVFGDGTITSEEKRAIIRWIRELDREPNPGGFGLGRIGPVAEGALIWLVGVPALIFLAIWLAGRVHHD